MTICVAGLWHLGCVTAACLAHAGHDVIGFDADTTSVDRLQAGIPPIAEPGLPELTAAGAAAGRLRFTTDAADALARASVLWLTFDTPVDADDRADVDFVVSRAVALLPLVADDCLIVSSSQLPVGTVARLERAWAEVAGGRRAHFACVPENLRLGQAVDVFTRPDRVVAGVRDQVSRERLMTIYAPITDRLEWMSVESAEMAKHAVNAFLATSIAFINELAGLCERVGADARDVERALRTERRIGDRLPLSPGGAFGGGTLARDVSFLTELGSHVGRPTRLMEGVRTSNTAHRAWAARRLDEALGGVSGRRVAVWGLTYKPGTDTLRSSDAVTLCAWLRDHGAAVHAFDPAIATAPAGQLAGVVLHGDAVAAARGADALVVMTPWPVLRETPAAEVVSAMASPIVLDANRFLDGTLGSHPDVRYVTVGRTT